MRTPKDGLHKDMAQYQAYEVTSIRTCYRCYAMALYYQSRSGVRYGGWLRSWVQLISETCPGNSDSNEVTGSATKGARITKE